MAMAIQPVVETPSDIVDGLVSTLPEELVFKILSSLAVTDLVSCCRVNHYLNGIIANSQKLQHHIDTAIAGVVDNPNSPFSLLERRDALARRQEAWDTFQPQRIVELDDNLKLLDVDGTWLQFEPLREQGYHKIEHFSACSANREFVAIGMQ
jgi:hypothetical protein